MRLSDVFSLAGEVFSSSLWVLLLFSVVVGFFILRTLRPRRQVLYCLVVTLAVWFLCELLLHLVHGFLWELLVLFLGTFALGGAIGALLAWAEYQVRKRL